MVIAKRLEKVDVLQIWGSHVLNVRMGPLVADLLAKSKVDVLQIWGDNPRSILEGHLLLAKRMQPPRSLCCKTLAAKVSMPEGASSLTDDRNL